jgi:ribosomal protein S18 acetylase RimI-like enzyme
MARDLKAIAELVELCFGKQLDRGDLAAVREMKTIASLGPLLWLLGAFDTAGLGLGYVWVADGQVVGNVSTYRAGSDLSGLGMGWLVANVAVHPDQRRRGIARALVEAALDLSVRRGGRWAVLQLEHDNDGARALYEDLGFEEVGRLTQWVRAGVSQSDQLYLETKFPARRRRVSEWEIEMALAARDRQGGLTWARPLEKSHFRRGRLSQAWDALDGKHWARWVRDGGAGLLGSLWVETVAFGNPRLTLFLDPSVNQAEVGLELVREGLKGLDGKRHVRLEASDRDPAFARGLEAMGFRVKRTLAQMRWVVPR